MSLTNRRGGRRVAAVIVGASLLVLGLEAPAFAVPAVSGVSPNSGPIDCVVVVTGTGFLDFPQAQQDLTFVGPAAGTGDDVAVPDADWTRISATEIWAVVPGLVVAGTSYTVTLTDPNGGTSTGTFLATTGAGGCAPTITSFTPTCGAAGTTVVITGTNLIGPDLAGGEVRFSPYADAQEATHTVPDVAEPTSLSVLVPSGAGDGPIGVTTWGTQAPPVMQVFSATNFDVPPPDCVTEPPPGDRHERNVRLRLRAHLIGKGKVTVPDGTTECAQNVPVKIQRKRSGGWRTVKATTTSVTGSFKKRLPDKPGVYRAVARKITLPDTGDICVKDVSNRVRHRH